MNPETADDVDDDHADTPLEDLADEVAERRDEAEDPLWEALKEGGSGSVDTDVPLGEFVTDDVEVVEEDGPSAPAEDADLPGVYTVSKRNYCMQCPHFSDPPEVRCTHEGTSILSFVDSEHVRVQDCVMIDPDDV